MSDDGLRPAVEVGRGSPTPEELAAIIAVVADAYASERATETVPDRDATTSSWMRSARGLREPWDPSRRWGSFSG